MPARTRLAVVAVATAALRRVRCFGLSSGRTIAAVMGIDTAVAAKVEGVRSKAKRLAERGWLFQEASGAFSAGRRRVASPGGGPFA
ncbi:hypothetical protein ACFU8W_49415 [Streptomyces sp. NPDC057565]|uniref:hypothetical protein n=1 Tax=Streptomyces sp. NPDC057565 TaxID=3346169 RepID=UPI0036A29489